MERNIRALIATRKQMDKRRPFQQRVAEAITRFTGSMRFLYVHALYFGGWIVINLGLIPFIKPFDPYPFVMLAMAASVEAIFLSTFVLISQNRMAELADRRADLDVQINLLAEHEITRLVHMVDAIAERLGVQRPAEPELEELKKDVKPEAVLAEIERAEEQIQSDDGKPSESH